QIDIEDGSSATVDLSGLVDDADADPTNEYNTGVAMNAGAVEVTDGGGTLGTSLISTDANNDIIAGADGALYLNVASVSIAETITNLSDNGDGTFTYVNENGVNQTVAKSDITDNGNGTYTFTNNDGTDVTLDTRAASNPYDNSTSGLAATDVQAAIDEVAGGSSDDQNLTGATLTGTDLQIDIENGSSANVDLAGLVDDADADPTNELNTGISFDGTNLTVTDAGGNQSVDISSVSTDNQNLTGATLTGTDLQIDIEDGSSATVDLAGLVDDADADPTNELNTGISFDGTNLTVSDAGGNQSVDISGVSTDDQTAAEVTYDNSISGLTASDVQAAIDEVAAGSTDNQNLTGATLTGTDLQIDIEDGSSATVDLAGLVDDADADPTNELNTGISFDGTNLTVTDAGGNQSVDISSVSTDDQTIATDGSAGNISIENGNALTLNVDDADADPTNEFNTGAGMNAGSLEVTDGGGTQSTSLISADANNDITAGSDGALYLNVASVTISETITNLSDNGDGTFTYVNENGVNQTVAKADITDNGNGTYTFTNNDGSDVILDTRAASNPYDNSTSGLAATDVQAAIDEVAGGSTDDQNLTLSGNTLSIEDGNSVDLSGYLDNTDDQTISLTGNTLAIEDGNSVDLSGYLDNTDDQTAAEVTYDNSTSGLTASDVQAAIDEVAAGSTDDQNISGSGLSGTTLTIGIENGTNETVDLSSLADNTDDQTISLTGNTLAIEDGNSVDLSGYLDNTDDQTAAEVNIADAGGNFTSTEVEGALAELAAGSTDDQNLTLSGNTLSIEDGNNVDLSGYLDNTDDQNISGSGLSGTTLTIGIENGTNESVDLSSLVGTDDQTAAEVTYDNSTSGLTASDVQAAIDEVAAGSTDDQNLTLSGNTLSIEDGNNVDLSGYLDNTDDQNLTLSGNTLSIEDGNNVDLSGYLDNTDDQTAAEVTYDNSTSGLTASDVQAAIDEVAAGSTDDQNLTGATLTGTSLQVDIEDGSSATVDLAGLVDDADADPTNEYNTGVGMNAGSLEVTDGGGTQSTSLISTDANNDIAAGSDGALYLNVASVTISETITNLSDNGDGTFTYVNENGVNQTVAKADITDNGNGTYTFTNNDGSDVVLDTRAASNPYDNSTSGLTATDVQAAIDEVAGGSTDDQNLTLSGNTLSIEDGNNVDLSGYLDNTDDQNISGSGLSGTTLTIGIENGTNETVDLASLVGTDDQTAAEVTYDNSTSGLTASDVQAAIDEVAAGSTDDQNLTLSGNTLSIEDGNNVDLSGYLDNTDDQNLTLSGNTLSIEDGNNVDLSGYLDNTDDQTAAEVTYDNSTSGLTASDVQAAIDEVAAGSTDDQNLTLSGNTLSIEDGNNVDLSGYLDNTDDQNLTGATLNGSNVLQIDIENGSSTSVDLSSLADNTDDQNLTLSGNTLSIEDGNNVDLSGYLDNTDNQNISGSGLSGTTLTIGIENGTDETVDLSSLVGTDDQTAAEVTYDNSTSGLTASDVQAAIDEVAAGSTDDQNLTLSGNTLSIEDGNNVDLSGYLDNTDDQNISGSGLSGTTLTIGIENGTNETVDLSSLVGTDDQNLTGATLNGSNVLQIDIENGSSTSVDLSSLADNTDDQNLTLSGNTLSIEDGNNVDLSGYLDNTDDQNLTLSGNTLSIEDGNNVDLSGYLDNTDDQNISGSGLSGTTLTIGIENGTNETVDLSSLVGTDDQNLTLSGNTLSIEDGNNVDLSGYLDNTDDQTAAEVTYDNSTSGLTASDVQAAIDEVAAGSTDDQNISGSGLSGTTLTIGIENGSNETVDLSSLADNTDDQNLTLSGNTLSIEDGNNVDLSGYLDNTDDQNISGSGLSGTTLTIGIENGTDETVDLSSLVGTDDQDLTGATLNGSNVLQIDIENGSSTSVDLSSLADNTDDQNLTLSGNTLSIEDGNNVDLSGYLDNTDDQNISGSGLSGTTLTIGIENGTNETVDLASLVDDADADASNELQTISRSGTDITLSDGGGTVSIADNDNDSSNEYNTTFAVNSGNLELTDGGGTLSVPVSSLGTDDQFDDEVSLRTPIDVDEGAESSPTNETTVQEVINAIAPITSKAARVFYPPSIAIDASANGTGFTVDLYAQYIAQFGTPAVASAGAPTALPTYAANELYYYVTYADPAVFDNMSIDANGVLTYDIIGQPTDYNSLINVVFVVR
ncbi:hypothetical protein SAMN04490243_0298, partial [Robiginitalea myxolifaciens]